ncbi:MAG TPA: hypothetical protein VGS06_01835 [Streptosporangiaceae bacterium]|nr:hypothetical protein [Streptosporangiaceae bacterium]
MGANGLGEFSDIPAGLGVMAGAAGELSVELQAEPDVDAEELAQLLGRLRTELLDLDVDAVQQPECGEAPKESKGAGLLAAGQLVVQLVTSPAVLASIIAGVRSWLGRNRARSVKLTIGGDALEVSGVSSAEQDRLIDLWVARHATGT